MSGQGKYTTYAPPNTQKNQLLQKLFGANTPAAQLPPQMSGGATAPVSEQDCIKAVVAVATAKVAPGPDGQYVGGLLPSDGIQTGNPLFPTGVDLSFGSSGKLGPVPNDISSVKWTNPGDPANPYVPDISSPGEGKTSGADKSVDPGIKTTDVKPNLVVGGPESSTTDPSTTSKELYSAQQIGVPGVMGDSGANT
jgi:hypothetical protein